MMAITTLLLAAALLVLGVFATGHTHHHDRRLGKRGNEDEEVAERPGFFGNKVSWNNETSPLSVWAMENFPTQKGFIESGARCAYKERSDDEEKMFESMFQLWKDAIAKGENKAWFNGRRLKTITVPTYFHVLQDGNKGHVSDAQIDMQMQVLNDAFALSSFEFQLMNQDGNKASRTSKKKWHEGKDETKYKAHLRRGRKNSLNVYFNQAKGYLGYAYYPSDNMVGSILDGVAAPAGYAAPYNLGDTLVHEVSRFVPTDDMSSYHCTQSHHFSRVTPSHGIGWTLARTQAYLRRRMRQKLWRWDLRHARRRWSSLWLS